MAGGQSWTAEEDAVIVRLRPTHTRAEIAQHLPGRSADSITQRARQLGLESKGKPKIVFTAEQIQKMCEMHANRTTYEEIADHFDVSLYIIFRTLSSQGVTRKNVWNRKPRPNDDAPEDLEPLEIAPGNFAADARSYLLITGREPRIERRESETPR